MWTAEAMIDAMPPAVQHSRDVRHYAMPTCRPHSPIIFYARLILLLFHHSILRRISWSLSCLALISRGRFLYQLLCFLFVSVFFFFKVSYRMAHSRIECSCYYCWGYFLVYGQAGYEWNGMHFATVRNCTCTTTHTCHRDKYTTSMYLILHAALVRVCSCLNHHISTLLLCIY